MASLGLKHLRKGIVFLTAGCTDAVQEWLLYSPVSFLPYQALLRRVGGEERNTAEVLQAKGVPFTSQ